MSNWEAWSTVAALAVFAVAFGLEKWDDWMKCQGYGRYRLRARRGGRR